MNYMDLQKELLLLWVVVFNTEIQIIAASLVQKLFLIIPDPYLEERAKRATGDGFSLVLSQVPDIPPDDYDKL